MALRASDDEESRKTKRARYDVEDELIDREDKQIETDTMACTFCKKTFKVRGLPRHQKRCEYKISPRSSCAYRVCIINEHVFANVLSFLGNQSLTKLQAVTGDRYPNCESNLSKYCCSCENDNPAINGGLCLDCELAQRPDFKPLITTTEARKMYGVYDLSQVPCDKRRHCLSLFARTDLNKHMIDIYKSRIGWLRVIETKHLRATKRSKNQRQAALDVYLQGLQTGFTSYAKMTGLNLDNRASLNRSEVRFVALTAALEERGLALQHDSRLCEEHIMKGIGTGEAVVDTMEEMEFLRSHTMFTSKSKILMDALSKSPGGVSEGHGDYRAVMQSCRDETKMQMCVEYLADNNGLMLPRKWERCRERFEEVKSVGMNPNDMTYYIYSDEGFL